MKKTDIECFPIYRMTASQLEEKRHTDGYIHMNINALETRWPCQKDFVSAVNDHTAEYLAPVEQNGSRYNPNILNSGTLIKVH